MNNPSHDGVEVLTMNNTVMKDAAKAENAFTSDETMRYKYMLREKAIRDYYSGLDDARQEGVKQGLAQGREEGLAQGREEGLAQGREQGLTQGREQGLAQGREQGLAQGAQQEKIANILGMLREGIDISVIAKITFCSVAEIQQIANKQFQSQ